MALRVLTRGSPTYLPLLFPLILSQHTLYMHNYLRPPYVRVSHETIISQGIQKVCPTCMSGFCHTCNCVHSNNTLTSYRIRSQEHSCFWRTVNLFCEYRILHLKVEQPLRDREMGNKTEEKKERNRQAGTMRKRIRTGGSNILKPTQWQMSPSLIF